MKDIIEIRNLKKSFNDVKAVDDISFKVKKGELFAFLGINGAGKSTTINILVGVLTKDSGECLVKGIPIEEIEKILPYIGIVFQSSVLDKKLTVYDNLKYRAMMYGMDKKKFEESLAYLVEKLELKPILKRTLEKLSGGQKRKVDIARALIHHPEILILDEPTTGLDPKTRKVVWEFIDELREKDNLTVILTTHYMEEAINANYVVIIDHGIIVSEGTPIELKNKYAYDYLRIYKYKEELFDVFKKENVSYLNKNNCVEVRFKNTNDAKDFINQYSSLILDLEIIKGTMDDVFLNVTGKDLKSV